MHGLTSESLLLAVLLLNAKAACVVVFLLAMVILSLRFSNVLTTWADAWRWFSQVTLGLGLGAAFATLVWAIALFLL